MRKRVSAASTFGLVLLRADGTVDASIGFGRCAHLGSRSIPRGFSPIALRVKRIGQDLHAFGQFFRGFRGRVQSFFEVVRLVIPWAVGLAHLQDGVDCVHGRYRTRIRGLHCWRNSVCYRKHGVGYRPRQCFEGGEPLPVVDSGLTIRLIEVLRQGVGQGAAPGRSDGAAAIGPRPGLGGIDQRLRLGSVVAGPSSRHDIDTTEKAMGVPCQIAHRVV
jgi:hypothetical protein